MFYMYTAQTVIYEPASFSVYTVAPADVGLRMVVRIQTNLGCNSMAWKFFLDGLWNICRKK
jgi:hypothetical protein